ncbi:hypothetical protein L1887_36286 [Cichorium endivia]|nr:hypothetical protein L1887_36286 [Cichorium endivia]
MTSPLLPQVVPFTDPTSTLPLDPSSTDLLFFLSFCEINNLNGGWAEISIKHAMCLAKCFKDIEMTDFISTVDLCAVNKPTQSLKLNEITIRHHRQVGPPAFIFTDPNDPEYQRMDERPAFKSSTRGRVDKDSWQPMKNSGILKESEGIFVEDAYKLLEDGIDMITDVEELLPDLLSYPLHDTLSSSEGKEGKYGWQKWVKAFGKSLKRE